MVDFNEGRDERVYYTLRTGGAAQAGLTVRDYFAAHSIQTAMQMVKRDLEKDGEIFHWNQSEREIVAGRAYNLADAMLKAREQ